MLISQGKCSAVFAPNIGKTKVNIESHDLREQKAPRSQWLGRKPRLTLRQIASSWGLTADDEKNPSGGAAEQGAPHCVFCLQELYQILTECFWQGQRKGSILECTRTFC